MSEEAVPAGTRSMRRGLIAVLGLQVLLALGLLVSDAELNMRFAPAPPLPSGPVSPGDQRRPFSPEVTTPDFTRTSPGIPRPDNMPDRLEFSLEEDAGRGEVLLIRGAIGEGDAARLEAWFTAEGEGGWPVALDSPGGLVEEALSIGRALRAREAATLIRPGAICLSACPYMLAGGTAREVSERGAVGMHQHYYETPGYIPAYWAVEDVQYGQGRTMAFLIEMGIEPGLMLYSLNTPPDQIYVLVEEELLESGLATEVVE